MVDPAIVLVPLPNKVAAGAVLEEEEQEEERVARLPAGGLHQLIGGAHGAWAEVV